MNAVSDTTDESGVRFFGQVTASISHEMKNVLAIINENAGLLEDLAAMAEKGKPLDEGRVKAVSGKIRDQVRRGDEIIKNMNRFAHSVDEPVGQVDLREVLGLVAGFSRRTASTKRILLELKTPETPVPVTTKKFSLENAIWLCLRIAMDAAGESSTIGLIADAKPNGASVRFTGLTAVTHENRPFGGEAEAVLAALGADLAIQPQLGEIVLSLPARQP